MRRDLGILFGPAEPEPAYPAEFQIPAPIEGGPNAPELCQLLERWSSELHPDDAIGQLKADGHRALWIGGQLVSREGIPMDQAAHSCRALAELERAYGKPMFFDGEYVHPEGLDACARPGGTIWLFDAVPLELWRVNGETAPLASRLEQLFDRGQHCFGPALGSLKPFLLPTAATAIRKARELWELGYEGLVVKSPMSSYDRRRSTRWLKLKNWQKARCAIVDLLPNRAGGLGSLLVDVDGQRQKIGTGPALTADARRSLMSLLKPGDVAIVEYAGRTRGGLLRDASLLEIADV